MMRTDDMIYYKKPYLQVALVTLVFLAMPWPIYCQQRATGATMTCESGYFGANCTGVCHCLNGPSVCDKVEGICDDYICDRGWNNSPYCQTPCNEGFFGINCEDQCHCPEGDTCNKVNGLCSNGSCHPDWSGPGCQTRLPKLTTPPLIVNITCDSFNLRWQTWRAEADIGDPPIGPYTIQRSENSSSWADVRQVAAPPGSEYLMSAFVNVDPYTSYKFRIRANRLDYGKLIFGIPGPSSVPVLTQDECYVPTTTSSTTTTVSTTTTTTTSATTTTTTTTEPTTATSTTTTTTTEPTTTLPPIPGPITNISITLDDEGNVVITWLPPRTTPSTELNYNASYRVIGIGDCDDTYRGPVKTVDVASTARSVTIGGLTPWRKYSFVIVTHNRAGFGEAVQRVFSSRETVPTGRISQLRVTGQTSRTIDLTWNEVNCMERGGVLRMYDVFVKSGNVTVRILTSPTNEIHVTGLIPYTNYTVQVRYVNKVGSGPLSDELQTETLQDVPAKPRNVHVVGATNTSLSLSWQTPLPTNGILLQYRVIYWRNGVEGTETTLTLDAADGTQTTITGLKPFTLYNIRVQARTGATVDSGWGQRSDAITHSTEVGMPGPPTELERTYRNESCLGIAWSRPIEQNGIIVIYKVSYRVVALRSISTIDPGLVEEEIPGGTLQYTACTLLPAAQYRFQVRASTSALLGDPATLDAWTEVGIPDIPPIPVVRKTTSSNITIRIQPVILTKGPVSGYFIVLERIDENPDGVFERAKRETGPLPDPVSTIPLPGTTVAYLERDELRVARNFVVGDGQRYGPYFNRRLIQGALYNIYFVVSSSLDGSTKMSFSQIQNPVRAVVPTTTTTTTVKLTFGDRTTTTASTKREEKTTLAPPEVTEAVVRRKDDTTLILAIVIPLVLLLILIAILIVYFCLFRKRKDKDEPKAAWLRHYATNFYDTTRKSAKAPWSDIYNLNESRHVTVNEENRYAPDDLKVADIHHKAPKISFDEEYKHLPQGKQFACTVAERPENADKNRFEHILPYDHSLVVLRPPSRSAYINANYVPGYDPDVGRTSRYIAAQSPFNDRTVADFWYMVYQERSTQIVFLANLEEDGVVKSEQYWPDDRQEALYELVAVRTLKTDYYANFVVRTFELRANVAVDGGPGPGPTRTVRQYHFTGWPDHGVPRDPIPLLEFRMKVRAGPEFGGGPMVVHCGTGVSRTAVFLAVDALLEQARYENAVNVYKYCERMRKARMMMVRTARQYQFIYDALLDALLTNYNVVGADLKTSYRLLSKINPITDRSLFREQFDVLERFTPALTDDDCRAALDPRNLAKNRFRSIVPPDEHRPVLRPIAGDPSRTDYVNAVYVDSYTLGGAFVVAQTPLPSTVVDFWRLVDDLGINCIVSMNGADFREETCADYLPPVRNTQHNYEPFLVRLDDVTRTDHVTVRTLRLSNALRPSERPRVVRQFQFESWKMYEKTPWSRPGFVGLIEAVNEWLEESDAGDSPVLVHCMDGASQSGLFCACSVICEKMMLEGQVDIFHTIKHMKRRRRHFVNSLEQYKFCFKLLWDYMNTRLNMNTLANGQVNTTLDTRSDQQLIV